MKIQKLISVFVVGLLSFTAFVPALSNAVEAPNDSGLSLEVSPSPIVESVKPGERKVVDLKIYNDGTATENLRLSLQSFKTDPTNSAVTLETEPPREIAEWVSFAQPSFTVRPGERVTQQVVIQPPETAAFNYNFAIIISRQAPTRAERAQSAIEGSVAVFTLLSIDRPGAVRTLSIDDFKTSKHVYEYLPATLQLKLKNTGNSLILPAGNAFIQRDSDSNEPISVLPVNDKSLYLLPGVTREYTIDWDDGVPVYVTTPAAVNGEQSKKLEWRWRDSQFRIGHYVAKVVVVYNDGQRDVPVEAEVDFWVLPWKLMLGAFLALLVLIAGIVAIIRYLLSKTKRSRPKRRA